MDSELISGGVGAVLVLVVKPLIDLIRTLVAKNTDVEQRKSDRRQAEETQYITKCELEEAKAQIISECEKKFATAEIVKSMRSEFNEVKGKLDSIAKAQSEQNLLLGELVGYYKTVTKQGH